MAAPYSDGIENIGSAWNNEARQALLQYSNGALKVIKNLAKARSDLRKVGARR